MEAFITHVIAFLVGASLAFAYARSKYRQSSSGAGGGRSSAERSEEW